MHTHRSSLGPGPSGALGILAVNHPPPHLFLEACGSAEPFRVGVGLKDEMQAEALTYDQPFLVIGRGPGADLTLEHWQVSRRHAYLQLLDGRFYCVDLGSRTGTHGGDAAERMGWLGRGGAIQIGPYTVRPDPPPRRAESARALPGVTWELPGRALSRSLWPMDQEIALVGRSPACKLRIVEADVSKFHCSLVRTRLGVWVVDLLGREGVLVNDQPVRFARLDDGDELRVGRHVIRPRYDNPPAPLPPPAAKPADSGLPATLGPGTAPAWAGGEVSTYLERPGGIVDPTISAVVHQFGLMQQQMFDQFHQTMMMMFEGFAAMQRETTGTLREEFERVRELSREIESLRAETTRLAEAASRPAPRLTPPPLPPPNGNGAAHRPGPAAPAGAPKPRPVDPVKRPAAPPADPQVDVHSQLLLRLSTIQAERQNRWQKILGMMSGKS